MIGQPKGQSVPWTDTPTSTHTHPGQAPTGRPPSRQTTHYTPPLYTPPKQTLPLYQTPDSITQPLPLCEQTDVCENITLPAIRSVITAKYDFLIKQ